MLSQLKAVGRVSSSTLRKPKDSCRETFPRSGNLPLARAGPWPWTQPFL